MKLARLAAEVSAVTSALWLVTHQPADVTAPAVLFFAISAACLFAGWIVEDWGQSAPGGRP